MASKRNSSKNLKVNLDLAKTIGRFVDGLSERSQKIVVQRHGLDGRKKRTLEEIGDRYGVTRERVRQIEAASLRELLASKKAVVIEPAEELLEEIIVEHGSIMEHWILINTAQKRIADEALDHHIEFILHVSDRFQLHRENDHFHRSWYLKEADLSLPKKIINSFIEILEEKNEPIHHELVVEHLKDHESAAEIEKHLNDPRKITSYLHLGKKIKKNPYQDWGLSHWNEIKPRGVKDKAYLVLKKEKKPLHFTRITSKINESGFDAKKAVSQTVHNELIKDGRFVLVGRGIYALADWGYKPGTVSDIVYEILKEANKPLTREEIVEAVLKQRLVKKNTVVLALQNRKNINRRGEAYYVSLK